MFKPAFIMRILLILIFSICQSFKQRNNCRKEKESDLACAINVSWVIVYIIQYLIQEIHKSQLSLKLLVKIRIFYKTNFFCICETVFNLFYRIIR